MADKKHLLMRLDSDWLGYPLNSVEEMLDDLTMNVVEASRTYENMVGDERALRTMLALDFSDGDEGWGIAQHELDLRKSNPHDRTPLIVAIPTLPYLFAEFGDDSRIDMLTALLTQGPTFNMHVVAGLNVAPSFSDYAVKAFTSLPPELRALFRRVNVGADVHDGEDPHPATKFFHALEDMMEVPIPPNPGQSLNSFFRPDCSECSSTEVKWFAFGDFRMLNEDYPKVIEKLDEAAEVVGDDGQVWRCESCGDWGVTSKPQREG